MISEFADQKKSFGVLIHPTSLPGGIYCGTFGDSLKDWLNLLSINKIGNWQFLPLNPVDSKGSPYSSPSSFAINPWFLDGDELIEGGFIPPNESIEKIKIRGRNLDFLDFQIADELSEIISNLILDSWETQSELNKKNFYEWCSINDWVDEYAIYSVLKMEFDNEGWWKWPKNFRDKDKNIIDKWKRSHINGILKKKLEQWHLHRQWLKIRKFARIKGVRLIGDLPFYVSRDSVDVWGNKHLFSVSCSGELISQSGVPPDYFSSTGQLWGTPVYEWANHEMTDFEWWKKRFKRQFELVDILRVDHFRALSGYWRVDGKAKNAIKGEWIKSPGNELLKSLCNFFKVKSLPIIAEDLGVITEDVNNLRINFGLPGMKILQFAFDGSSENPYLPENIVGNNWVVYTGTHDNPTTTSWWDNLDESLKVDIDKRYLLSNNPAWNLIKLGMKSNANLFIAPMQDILCLNDRFRLNKPGTTENNWKWKIKKSLNSIEFEIKSYGSLGKNFHRVSMESS